MLTCQRGVEDDPDVGAVWCCIRPSHGSQLLTYIEDLSVRSRFSLPLHKERLLRCSLTRTLCRFRETRRGILHPRLRVGNTKWK